MKISPISLSMINIPHRDQLQSISTLSSLVSFYSSVQNKQLPPHKSFQNEGHSGCITSELVFGWSNRRLYSTEVTSNTEKNYYKILGVTPNCSKSRIKVAYYKLSKKYHPDVNKTEEAKQKFQDISEAYDILSNALTRQQYDKARASHSPHYRGNVTYGQEKFKSRNIYPMGRSTTYNFDEWHDQHYKSSLGEALRQKRVKESEEATAKRDYVHENMNQDVREPSVVPILAMATVITMFGFVYMLMKQKIEKLQNNVKGKS